jgi:murein DD-endopeptidase MepM/ murein hydrolase activator NlpD
MIEKSKKKRLVGRFIFLIAMGALFFCFPAGCADKHAAMKYLDCSGYPDWNNSPYILPYRSGESYPVIQGNCADKERPWTHYDRQRYAYDFGMPVGTAVIASRSGTVVFVRDLFTDNDHGKDQGNAIVILQEDGTYALYAHITHQGSQVKVGQIVAQGTLIACSGNSGESPAPHLHFQVNECGDFVNCNSLPVTFRNAAPNTGRLEKGQPYSATE